MKEIFIWDKSFLTNNEIIDSQHFQLIETINEAISYTINDKMYSQDIIATMKNKILKYTETHFKTEEKIMDDAHVFEKHLIEHKKLHQEFINWFISTFENTNDSSALKINESLDYLIQWLAYHILSTDKYLFKQIEMIKSGISPVEAFEIEHNKNDSSTQPLVKALKTLYYIVLDKNQQLEFANANLETKVKQRTAELEEANKRLEAISLTDTLTGLPNRRYVEMILEQTISTYKRYKSNCVVMFIDVDKFKSVNDIKGHDVGDRLLKWIAEFLQKNLRKSDIVSRLGGDEFVVICPDINQDNGILTANKLITQLKETSNMFFTEYWKPSLSIGLCSISEQNSSTEAVLRKADEAMYQSKQNGGNLTTAST
jgi:hemerythrin